MSSTPNLNSNEAPANAEPSIPRQKRLQPVVLLPSPRSRSPLLEESSNVTNQNIASEYAKTENVDGQHHRPKVWFITGCSSGLGKQLALEALKRGDKVIATARGALSRLDDLKKSGAHVMECDVTVSPEDMKEIARVAEGVYHGGIDVLVNNAGYAKFGNLEELGPEGLLEQYKTNVFGVANVTSAFLPYLRKRRSGTVIITGSRSGMRVVPMVGAYGTSKAALNLYSETLAQEVAPFNIRVLTSVPGGFNTWGRGESPTVPDPPGPGYEDYKPLYENFKKALDHIGGSQLGDPKKYAELLVDVINGEGLMRQSGSSIGADHEEGEEQDRELRPWPERLVIGSDAVADVRKTFRSWEDSMNEYGDMARSTDRRPYPENNI